MHTEGRRTSIHVGAAHVSVLSPDHVADAVDREVHRRVASAGTGELLERRERLPGAGAHRDPDAGAVREGDHHPPSVRGGGGGKADDRSLTAVDLEGTLCGTALDQRCEDVILAADPAHERQQSDPVARHVDVTDRANVRRGPVDRLRWKEGPERALGLRCGGRERQQAECRCQAAAQRRPCRFAQENGVNVESA